MILIADSGTTKTDWALVDEHGHVRYFETQGFNPYYRSSRELSDIVEKELMYQIDEANVAEIYFYGSGCSTDTKKMIVEDSLKAEFHHAHIEVDHDLMGAARALLGREEGIACILGTGSNSCQYDGEEITENVPSLGFLYGDEGSGTHIGKTLVTAYLHNKLPEETKKLFESTYNYSLEQILDESYNHGLPNRFLSSFSRFVKDNISDDYLKEIVCSSFRDFFTFQVKNYSKHKETAIHFTGSVAFAFRDILEEAADEMGLLMGSIVQKPIEGLIAFHMPEE